MKYAYIQVESVRYPITTLCRVLAVSRSGFYAWRCHRPSDREQANQQLLHEVRAVHAEVMESYGSPRMHVELKARGHSVGLGRVERLMRHNGIQARRMRQHRIVQEQRRLQVAADNVLNRCFTAWSPNEKWVSDITFIETREGWLYLAIVLDLYSRAIVGWSMSALINGRLVRDALAMAIEQRENPRSVLVHSDQGSQYTAAVYRSQLAAHDMMCSMSRKGECHDNAVAESFFSSLKLELTNHADYKTRDEARSSIFKYIELFYNRKRRHSYLNYLAPLEYERRSAA